MKKIISLLLILALLSLVACRKEGNTSSNTSDFSSEIVLPNEETTSSEPMSSSEISSTQIEDEVNSFSLTNKPENANSKNNSTNSNSQNKTPKDYKVYTNMSEEVPKKSNYKKHDVIQSNDFPNDGNDWYRATYAWVPKEIVWGIDEEAWQNNHEMISEVNDVTWTIDLTKDSRKSMNRDTLLDTKTIENVKPFMIPTPTLEESKKIIGPLKEGETLITSDIWYGEIEVYVCIGEYEPQKSYTTYVDNDGSVYDENWNYLYNLNEWGDFY